MDYASMKLLCWSFFPAAFSRSFTNALPSCLLVLVMVLMPAVAAKAADAIAESIIATGDLACRINKISWQTRGENYEPAQTRTPGASPRHVSDDRVNVTWWPRQGRAVMDWIVNTHYPFPKRWTYKETLTAAGGKLAGADGFRPSADGILTPARVMVRNTDLWLRLPAYLAAMGARDKAIAIGYTDWQLSGETGVMRAFALEKDPPQGRVEHELIYNDWQTVDGLPVPAKAERYVGGILVRREYLKDWSVTYLDKVDECIHPREFTQPAGAEWAADMSHWILRRLSMGAGSDADMSTPVELKEVGQGLYQVLGSSHHSLIVETGEDLVVVDAPLYPERSRTLIKFLSQRWPAKRISYLVLTHHHHDHSGGMMPFVKEGARLVVASEAQSYFTEIIQKLGFSGNEILTIDQTASLSRLDREVRPFRVRNSHADGMLAVYIPDARHVFVTDLYSPGRDTHHPLWAQEFYQTLRWKGLTDVYISGGHGHGTETFAELQRWVLNNGAVSDY